MGGGEFKYFFSAETTTIHSAFLQFTRRIIKGNYLGRVIDMGNGMTAVMMFWKA